MSWFDALILGIVQGLTEFLPVSSTAHVSLVGRLLMGQDPSAAFSAVIQLGTTAAMVIYFWRDIWRILKAWFLSLTGKVPRSDPDARLGWFIIIGSLPIALIGLLFQKQIETSLRNLWVTVAVLLIVGIVLLLADVYTDRLEWVAAAAAEEEPEDEHHNYLEDDYPTSVRGFARITDEIETNDIYVNTAYTDDEPEIDDVAEPAVTTGMRTLDRMTWPHAIILGLAQALALIPGVSRSGATTSAGLFMGYDRPSAARYSFLLAIPAVLASGLYELKGIDTTQISWGSTLVATVVAFVVGFAVIAWLLRFISTHTFQGFAIYRIVLAIVVAALILVGVLPAMAPGV